jgi:hypothetical protein
VDDVDDRSAEAIRCRLPVQRVRAVRVQPCNQSEIPERDRRLPPHIRDPGEAALRRLPRLTRNFFNLSEKRAALAKGRDPNPFVDPAGYKAYVETAEKQFLAVVKAQKPE